MGKYTRYSSLLIHAMSPELREEFFSEGEQDTDAGWDLFETLYPEEADILMEVLQPMLDDVIKELQFKRDYNILLSKGDELGAARLAICHRADKLNWDKD
ncbi:MAG: hypothetical protein ACRC8W_05780 [Plesiomonas shigelloides]